MLSGFVFEMQCADTREQKSRPRLSKIVRHFQVLKKKRAASWRSGAWELSEHISTVFALRNFIFEILIHGNLGTNMDSNQHGASCWMIYSNAVPKHWGQGGLQRDVVYLCWSIAPSYTSPNAGERGGLAGSQPMSTALHITWHGAQINCGDLPPYLTYDWGEALW